ncbi:hypothetical protein D9M71_600540 [compost metagenome]
MIGADQQAHQVRHHQADETDQAGCGHGRTHPQRRAEHQLQFDPLDIEAQMAGFGLTEQHGIERRRTTWQPERYTHRHDQQWPQTRIAGAIEAAQVPESQST